MDLSGHLLAALAPHGLGDEVVPGARLVAVSSELGLRLMFAVGGGEIHVELAREDEPVRFVARTPRLKLAYRAGTGAAVIDPAHGAALCQAVARLLAPREEQMLAAIAREAAAARAHDEDGTRIREVRVDRLLEPATSGGGRYLTFTPYVGCLIGCRFCYAQSRVAMVRRLEQLPDTPWGSYVDVRINAAEVLARELPDAPPLPIKLCLVVSDPYHAVERRYRLTRACLEVLRDAPAAPATIVLTRSALVARDLDVLTAMPRAYAGCSIPTLDDEIGRHFEPRASPVGERLAALRRLRAAGVRTFAVVQPQLPGDLEAFADALALAAASVRVDRLHGAEGAARDFADPRFAHALDPRWQDERAAALKRALEQRGVGLWPDELPPELS